MNEEQLKILEMIEKGQVTAAEGMELLEALKAQSLPVQVTDVVAKGNHNYRFFRVRVTSDNNTVNVNVNIPISLLSTIGEIADNMTGVIPPDARKEMAAKGVDLSNIDFKKVIDDLVSGMVDDPNIIDIEAWDEGSQSMIKVKIYVD
ncbi:MAG: hypothetical protein AB7D16_02315 [Eubacteriaceae bacterium]|jgi:hypothetical protein|nr:hypothetical protein [Eubacteriaceae bacterium]MDK2935222.1 hypothetical protein [Eubacteriaceae bacterium]